LDYYYYYSLNSTQLSSLDGSPDDVIHMTVTLLSDSIIIIIQKPENIYVTTWRGRGHTVSAALQAG